ncbi:MAG TPA: vitamin K epoxide reductase family protein [Thermoanaerobaculia bacterium]|jgi:uncharacterized membrane protein
MPPTEVLFWVALVAGATAAAAALYGRYRVLPALLTGPKICRLEAGGCAVLFRTPTAALLGVPNAMLGLVAFGLLAAGRVVGADSAVLLVVATPAVLMSLYLTYVLLRDRLECRICWMGNVANVLIWSLLAAETFGR